MSSIIGISLLLKCRKISSHFKKKRYYYVNDNPITIWDGKGLNNIVNENIVQFLRNMELRLDWRKRNLYLKKSVKKSLACITF